MITNSKIILFVLIIAIIIVYVEYNISKKDMNILTEYMQFQEDAIVSTSDTGAIFFDNPDNSEYAISFDDSEFQYNVSSDISIYDARIVRIYEADSVIIYSKDIRVLRVEEEK